MVSKPDTPEQLAATKAEVRKSAFAIRKAAHSPVTNRHGSQKLWQFLEDKRGLPTSGYMAIRTEIDPLTVMTDLAEFGAIGVPVILGKNQPLEFRRWQPQAPMQAGLFGALIPGDTEIVIPQILIVPLLAFDHRGHRLGYGGGFYDRTLQQLRASGEVLAVGFAYAAQQVDEVPTEATDQALDVIVTDSEVLTISS